MSNSIAQNMLNVMQSEKYNSTFKKSNSFGNKLSSIINDLNELGDMLDEVGLEKSASAALFTLQTLISEASEFGHDQNNSDEEKDMPEEFEATLVEDDGSRSPFGLLGDMPENTDETMFVTEKSPFSSLNIFNKPSMSQWLFDVSGDAEPSKKMINLAQKIQNIIMKLMNEWLSIRYGVNSPRSFDSWCKENKIDTSEVFNIDNLSYALYDRFAEFGIKEFTLREMFGDKLAHSLSQFIEKEYPELIGLIKELEIDIDKSNKEIDIARINLSNPNVAQASRKF